MLLHTINANSIEPTKYTDRKVVKGIVVDDKDNVLLLPSGLIGGGVEENETDEQALYREALEETGMEIEIIKPLGQVITYRDVLKKKYIINGYLCKYMKTVSAPTTTDSSEQKMKAIWQSPKEGIARLETEIQLIKQEDPSLHLGDIYQSKVYNRETAVVFLKQAFR